MTLWVVRAGTGDNAADTALSNNLIGVGWRELGDLSRVGSREELQSLMRQCYPDAPDGRLVTWTSMLWQFLSEMKPGDLVALPIARRSSIAFGEVTGSYKHSQLDAALTNTRSVRWLKELPRIALDADARAALSGYQTLYKSSKSGLEGRIRSLLTGKIETVPETISTEAAPPQDLGQQSSDEIVDFIGKRFRDHALARLVNEVLKAEGYVTEMSEPGPDGGVDILAARGFLGIDRPRICVQVKSGRQTVDVKILREFQGVLQNFGADQGLVVSWGGYTREAEREARSKFFQIRLWDSSDLVSAIQANYDRLSADIQAEIPLKQIWVLVHEAPGT